MTGNPESEIPSATCAKMAALRASIAGLRSAAVAYSAGVDSTFLLRVAHDVLGDRAVAVTVRAPFTAASEGAAAGAFCRSHGIRHVPIDIAMGDIPHFSENPTDRCYYCKRALFGRILDFAGAEGIPAVLEGSNVDDDGDYRPGRRAIRELGVLTPLHDAGLTKAEIRLLSRALGLPTADKPSSACLASRFPCGERITIEGLKRVERAEGWLRAQFPQLRQLRVRSHAGGAACVEVMPCDIPLLAARAGEIDAALRGEGFRHVAMDLRGYRTGSQNWLESK